MKKSKNSGWDNLFLLTGYLFLFSCNTNINNDRVINAEGIKQDTSHAISLESLYNPQVYIDSMNNLKDFNNMPYFLTDSCMDGNALFWEDLHHPRSIRKYIIDNVDNLELLNHIVKNQLFTNRCNSDSANTLIPYYDLSWNQIVEERLKVYN